ncbi:E3 ubiquitin-protein ligase ATL76-like [Durio zibethinus]|uniref:RING-type E3 ubiquitin transferase n=1 Tax=Durio zibethinus TaxID=66656 RepID=A0A6P5YKB3_DURZI|nr:E3 ubiquitin-protein ligase ATL76-like [Durio zibethinus]
MYSTSSTSSELLQDFLVNFHSRKLLVYYKPLNQTSVTAAPPYSQKTNLDENVFMVLSVLLCGVISSLGLNFLVRYALRCPTRATLESNDNTPAITVNKGIEHKALKTFPVVNYSEDMNLPGLDMECVICLSEFVPGEHLRLLPKCNHGFHVLCIDKWLKSHSSCPKCRHCLIETCQKIMGDDQTSSSESCLPAQDSIVNILPLELESMVHSYRGV